MQDIVKEFLSLRLALARAVSKIVPPHDVEDIVQETYVRLSKVGNAEHIEHPKSYLFQTARNLALDSLKSARSRLTTPWNESTDLAASLTRGDRDDVLDQAASTEEFGHFCEAVRQLPIKARRVFVLKKVYGYSQREIAQELELSESTVEKHVALSIRRCAQYLQERRQETTSTAAEREYE